MKRKEIKDIVKEKYGEIAKKNKSCCSAETVCCEEPISADYIGQKIGYSEEEMKAIPDGSNLGLGCGNPVALASLKKGETVLDLGSGAGFDCFLAANRVGKRGKVIGVDMTSEMVEKARENAKKGGYDNVEFRLGDIEDLPVADSSVDIIISNCVINLSPDKNKVFREAFRVLRPGGRLMISDIVLVKKLPDYMKKSVEAYVGCISGAIMKDDYLKSMEKQGFRDIKIIDEVPFPAGSIVNKSVAAAISQELDVPVEKLREAADSVVSISVRGVKPIRG